MSPAPSRFARNSTSSTRHPRAAGAVASAGRLFGERSLARVAARSAVIRSPAATASVPAVRTTMGRESVPSDERMTKLPENVAPASR